MRHLRRIHRRYIRRILHAQSGGRLCLQQCRSRRNDVDLQQRSDLVSRLGLGRQHMRCVLPRRLRQPGGRFQARVRRLPRLQHTWYLPGGLGSSLARQRCSGHDTARRRGDYRASLWAPFLSRTRVRGGGGGAKLKSYLNGVSSWPAEKEVRSFSRIRKGCEGAWQLRRDF